MGRPVILSNGTLMVGLNEQGLVHDFYYPYVGLENLTTSRSVHHKIGVWVNGQFSWVDDGSWDVTVDFEAEALISQVKMTNNQLQVELKLADFVDYQYNAFCRNITIINQATEAREVRLFMHQVFQISRAGRADTALYEPEDSYILDYKGRCSLLIYGQTSDGQPYDQYAIGNYGIEGKAGTYLDAEDGELSGNAVEHGGVDSVIRFSCPTEPGASSRIDYWIVAADSQYTARRIHHRLQKAPLAQRLAANRLHWQDWLAISEPTLKTIPEAYQTAIKKSLLIIKAHTDKHGGILASGDSSIYNFGRDYYSYVWPRDGAYAIWPLIRLGYTTEAKQFFEFCRDILSPKGYLMHKYQPDRAIGSTWHPLLHNNRKELAIQEDETAIVIYMLGEYQRHSGDTNFVRDLYPTLIEPAANFMADFIDAQTGLPHASYDLWEEKFLTTTYTVAVVYQALLVAANFAEQFGHPTKSVQWLEAANSLLYHSPDLVSEEELYIKGYHMQPDGELQYDNTLDISSVYGVMMFGYHGETIHPLINTVTKIEQTLLDKTPSGGLPRYENDHYFASEPAFAGNPWFVSTLWLAQYYIRTGKPDQAQKYIDWTLSRAYSSGVLSEQVNPSTGMPLSVAPLVWSHAELINTVTDLAAFKKRQAS